MEMDFVQDAESIVADGGTLAFGSAVGSGTLLNAYIRIASSTITGDAISDSLGNTWHRAAQSEVAVGLRAELWYAACPTGGACTVTFDLSGSTSPIITIAEFSGFTGGVTAGPANTAANGSNTTTHTAGEITTTVAASLITAIFTFDSSFSVASRLTGWSALTGSIRHDASYKIASATETTDGQITTPDVERGPSAIAAFSETAGGGGGGGVVRQMLQHDHFTGGLSRFRRDQARTRRDFIALLERKAA